MNPWAAALVVAALLGPAAPAQRPAGTPPLRVEGVESRAGERPGIWWVAVRLQSQVEEPIEAVLRFEIFLPSEIPSEERRLLRRKDKRALLEPGQRRLVALRVNLPRDLVHGDRLLLDIQACDAVLAATCRPAVAGAVDLALGIEGPRAP